MIDFSKLKNKIPTFSFDRWYHYPIRLVISFFKFFIRLAYSDGKFTLKKFALSLVAFIVASYIILNSMDFMWEGTKYLFTVKKDEIVFLSDSNEISDDVYNVKGCEAETCSVENSLYFRIEADAFAQVWSLTNKGTIFFPDYISAIVAPGINKCKITSYGTRWKFLIRHWNIYPRILDIKCGGL
jgi:hypothetical protein